MKLVESLITNPKRIFLIDALGALLTSFSLFVVLTSFEKYFGMPVRVLHLLSVWALCLFFYSIICHLFLKENWKKFLGLIMALNVLYSIVSLITVINHSKQLTTLGITYFILEIIVIGIVVFIEYKAYKIQPIDSTR